MSNSKTMDEVVWPAVQVGAAAGATGFTVGAFAGVLRATSPALFALASGVQWFTLGSTFWGSRAFIMQNWGGREQLSKKERTQASTIAGAVSGIAGGSLRGRRNIIPGLIMFSAFGFIGQTIYNSMDEQKTIEESSPKEKKTLKDSWLNGKWSPMKVLSDEEYKTMLEEKLMRIEVQIGEVEESIESVRRVEREKGKAQVMESKS